MATIPRLSQIPDRLTESEFWVLFGEIEHEQLDFKRGAPDLTTIIPAMAMTSGGLIILGVSDQRVLVGCPLSQNTFDRVMKAGHAVGVEPQVKEVSVDSTKLTVVAIQEVGGRIITTPDGRLVRRIGSENQPLVGDALARFVRARDDRPWEEGGIAGIRPEDIDVKLVNQALARDGKPPVRRDSVMRALVDLGVAEASLPPGDPAILGAGVVLFAKQPTKYVRGASVQIVRRTGMGPGPSPTIERQEMAGPIPVLLENVLAFTARHTRKFEVVAGTHREVLAEYPPAALREAVLNALAHRDYGLQGATVDITIWDDRIEIRSPGSLPGHITIENMRVDHFSRNRRIMRVLKLMGLVEEYGEGIDRIFIEMEARLMEPPLFAETAGSVSVTLRNRFLVSVEDQVWLALLGHYELSSEERRILVATRREGVITPRRVRTLLPDAHAESLLRGAVVKGLLVRAGRRGGVRYLLSDEVIMRAGSTGLEAQSRKRQMLLDEIRRRGSLSTVEGAELLREDMAVTRHILNDLVSAGLAQARGNTRGRRYYPA